MIGEHEIAPAIMGKLRDAFADFDLPYKVDIVDWATLTPKFRPIIESSKVVLRTATPKLQLIEFDNKQQ